jgi:hypothetical protein
MAVHLVALAAAASHNESEEVAMSAIMSIIIEVIPFLMLAIGGYLFWIGLSD